MEFESDAKGIAYVPLLDRKIPLTVLMRALGFGSDDEIYDIFGQSELLDLTIEKDVHKIFKTLVLRKP